MNAGVDKTLSCPVLVQPTVCGRVCLSLLITCVHERRVCTFTLTLPDAQGPAPREPPEALSFKPSCSSLFLTVHLSVVSTKCQHVGSWAMESVGHTPEDWLWPRKQNRANG